MSVETKHCARCNQTKSAAEFGNNAARRDGLSTYCRACTREYMSQKSYDKDRWAAKKQEESIRNKAYRTRAAERIKHADRARAQRFRKEQPGLVRARNIARKHGQIQATPAWANLAAINAVYRAAKELQAQDGIERHVDHEIPLKHPMVCGLHVHNNLRVLTAQENMRKHNHFHG